MKAVVYKKYGPASVLHEDTLATPTPKPLEVRIKVMACEATKADCEMRSFNFPVKWFALPLRLVLGVFKPRNPILGAYVAGVVDAVGDKVTKFKVGDKLYGSTGFKFGGYAEYVCLSEKQTLSRIPENASFADAAAMPLGGLNALHFMNLANLKPGESILINGAAGSIGAFAVQIAKHRGAVVTAVDAGHKVELLKKLGADDVVNYQQQPLNELSEHYDVVFNMIAGMPFEQLTTLLKPAGRLLLGNPRVKDMFKSRKLNKAGQQQALYAFANETIDELKTLTELFEAGHIFSAIDSVLKPSKASEAHEKVEQETRVGAIILSYDLTQH
jgi:NADPH:quinone reductase-like Zn-dependent oxidoreductase